MAIVTRKYVSRGPDPVEMLTVIPSASVINGSSTWAEIQYDDTVAGTTETLDEYMKQFGYEFDNDAGKTGIRVRQNGAGNPIDIRVNGAGEVFAQGFPVPNTSFYDCPATVSMLDTVYISAANTVDKASALDNTKPAIGIVIAKPTPTTATVRWYGEIGGFVGLVSGATYFLGTIAGAIADVAPVGLGNIVQRLGVARNTTTLLAMIDRDWTVLT